MLVGTYVSEPSNVEVVIVVAALSADEIRSRHFVRVALVSGGTDHFPIVLTERRQQRLGPTRRVSCCTR